MAKASGVGWTTLDVDDVAGVAQNVKNDVTNLQFATPRGTQDVTGLDMPAIERSLLLADFSLSMNGAFNGAGVHTTLKYVTCSAIARTASLAVNTGTLSAEVMFSEYNVVRAQGGDLGWSAAAALCNGTPPTWGP